MVTGDSTTLPCAMGDDSYTPKDNGSNSPKDDDSYTPKDNASNTPKDDASYTPKAKGRFGFPLDRNREPGFC